MQLPLPVRVRSLNMEPSKPAWEGLDSEHGESFRALFAWVKSTSRLTVDGVPATIGHDETGEAYAQIAGFVIYRGPAGPGNAECERALSRFGAIEWST